MSKTNYVTMTDRELKCYFLEHRDDAEAFQAYMERVNAKSRHPIILADELAHLSAEEQVQLVAQRLQERFGDSL